MVKILILLVIVASSAAAPVQDQRCPADIVYVVDQSSSVTSQVYYTQVVPFLLNLTTAFNVGITNDHIAFVPYATPIDTEVAFFLDYSYDPERVIEAVENQPYRGGATATVRALSLVRDEVFLTEEGARSDQYHNNQVAPIVLVFTDGTATDGDPTEVSQDLRKNGAKVFAVGVGKQVTQDFLIKIAGSSDHVFYVDNFDALDKALIDAIISSTKCDKQ